MKPKQIEINVTK